MKTLSAFRPGFPATALILAVAVAACRREDPNATFPTNATAGMATNAPAVPTPREPISLVVNGSFESPPVPMRNGELWTYVEPADFAPWETDGEKFEVWTNGYSPANDDSSFHFPPTVSADGGQNLEIISDNTYQSSVWQTVPTLPGTNYTFSFQHSPRPGFFSTLRVYVNSDLVGKFDEDGHPLTAFHWQLFTTNFIATSTNVTLKFSDEGAIMGAGTHLDAVALMRR